MNRNDTILFTVLSQTTDRDAAIECTREFLASAEAARFTAEQAIDRIMQDVRWVEARR